MKKTIIIIIALIAVGSVFSCKKKTCAAYMTQEQLQDQNNKELQKSLKKRKHSKARMY